MTYYTVHTVKKILPIKKINVMLRNTCVCVLCSTEKYEEEKKIRSVVERIRIDGRLVDNSLGEGYDYC